MNLENQELLKLIGKMRYYQQLYIQGGCKDTLMRAKEYEARLEKLMCAMEDVPTPPTATLEIVK